MSRSLLFPFMIAIILHLLLARVQFDFFKAPLRARNAPKTMTVTLIKPIEEKKPSKAEKPPLKVKKLEKGRIQTSVTRKTKPEPKPRIKPTIKRHNTKIQRETRMAMKETSQEIEAPAYQPSPTIPPEKEGKRTPESEYAFMPDAVDIPTVLQKREDIPHAGEKHRSAPAPLDEPIVFATPNYKKNNPPSYPLLARRKHYEGTVLLDVLVRREGTVGSVRLAQSSGHETLDRSAIREVMKWTFYPGKKGDEPLEMWVTIPIRFQLR
jgi:TonB family protein